VNNKTDDEVINDIRAGNIAAYAMLLDKYKNMVFTLAFNILLNKEDAEELAQDVFVKAFKGLDLFKSKSLFSTWLYRIVINTALNKNKLKKITLIVSEEELIDGVYNDLNNLLKQQERNDRKKFIQSAMRSLKDDERLCITLFYLNELSLDEIHELTGLSIANIKVLLHRGRKNLYRQLSILLKSEMNHLI
jgi:RNA polymerase sigma factor (sigma-70 family)